MSEQSRHDDRNEVAVSGRTDGQVIETTATVPGLVRSIWWQWFIAAAGLWTALTGSSPLWLRVLAGAAAVYLLALPVVTIVRRWVAQRGTEVRITPEGLDYVDPRGTAPLRWEDVDAVGLRRGRVRRTGVLPWLDGPDMSALDLTLTREAAGRVHAQLRSRHRGESTYRIPLGSPRQQVDQLDAALTAYAPDKYDGTKPVGTVDASELC